MTLCGADIPGEADPVECLSCPAFDGCELGVEYFAGDDYDDDETEEPG